MGIFSVISLLGGLSIFLYGMDIMGDGLKSSSSKALKSMLEKVTHSAVPMQLNNMCAMPVRLASLLVPMEQIMAVVMQVPRSMPIIRG